MPSNGKCYNKMNMESICSFRTQFLFLFVSNAKINYVLMSSVRRLSTQWLLCVQTKEIKKTELNS